MRFVSPFAPTAGFICSGVVCLKTCSCLCIGITLIFFSLPAVAQEQKLTASDGQAGDQFGASVAISGDIAIVGAAADDDNGSSSGSAYVFSLPVTRFVAPTGSDTGNNCIDSLNPCATLMYAIEQAKDGDTIDLAAGTYNEPGLIIAKVLSMRGQGVVVQ